MAFKTADSIYIGKPFCDTNFCVKLFIVFMLGHQNLNSYSDYSTFQFIKVHLRSVKSIVSKITLDSISNKKF